MLIKNNKKGLPLFLHQTPSVYKFSANQKSTNSMPYPILTVKIVMIIFR